MGVGLGGVDRRARAEQGRNPRYRWLGLTGGILSTALLFLPLPFAQSSLVFGLLWCAMLAGSGLITLRRAALSRGAAGGG